MSSSHNDDHHSSEQKPVAFTVPLILASVLIFIIILFLSLCDPKPHHAGEEAHHDQTEAAHHDAAAHEDHDAAPAAEPAVQSDSVSAETTVPAAEPAPAADHH
jgi:hypothetical protein